MKFLQSNAAKQTSQLLRSLARRYSAAAPAPAPAPAVASPEELAKRNYANNLAEYNTVVGSLASQRRYYLLRDAYDDMMLDAVQPTRETFQSLLMGTMKGARLQDAIFFRNEMKSMGLVPDVALYNFLISTCGKCKNSDLAIQILEEMKVYEVKPNGQTYITLLNACAVAGRIDRVYAIVRDMTAAGAGLDKFCYAGLITAHKNKIPLTDDTASKIIELVDQSKGWSEESQNPSRNMVIGLTDEELYNMPTAEYIQRRGFLARELTVYHAAFRAFADLRNVEAMEILSEMLKKEGRTPDVFITVEIMRCYLHSGDLDKGLKTFSEHMTLGKLPAIELYVTLIEGAMVGHTARGMQVAQDTLVDMTSRNYFLTPKNASDLLQIAAGEKTGGYTMANYIWDLMRARNMYPALAAVEAYYKGLKEREIPEDDPRLHAVGKMYQDLRTRFVPGGGPRQ